jgi:hypothetical protein
MRRRLWHSDHLGVLDQQVCRHQDTFEQGIEIDETTYYIDWDHYDYYLFV